MSSQPTAFSDREPQDLGVERPFRPSAIVALILGLLSAVTVFSLSLFIIPLFGILLALYALRPSRQEQVQPSGRLPATLGIVLCVFFASWSFAFFQKRADVLAENGARFAVNWLDILGRGELAVALQLTKPEGMRQMSSLSLDDYYSESNLEAFQEFSEFRTEPTVSLLTSRDTTGEWEFVEVIQIVSDGDQDFIVMEFQDNSGTFPNIQISLSRSPPVAPPGSPPRVPCEWFVVATSVVDSNDDNPLG